MLTNEDAASIAERWFEVARIKGYSDELRPQMALLGPIEHERCYEFSCVSMQWMKTRSPEDVVFSGPGPVVVSKADSELFPLGAHRPPSVLLEDWEAWDTQGRPGGRPGWDLRRHRRPAR